MDDQSGAGKARKKQPVISREKVTNLTSWLFSMGHLVTEGPPQQKVKKTREEVSKRGEKKHEEISRKILLDGPKN